MFEYKDKSTENTFGVSKLHQKTLVGKANDILLLRLDRSIDIFDPKTTPICLPQSRTEETSGIFAG